MQYLVAAIRAAAGGGCYLPPGLSLSRVSPRTSEMPVHFQLTEREHQIMRLIVKGISLTAIGENLHLSVKTVSTYRTRLLAKLKLTSNAELVRYCLEQDIGD